MNVINFVAQNWDFILLIIAAVTALAVAIFKGNKTVVMKMLFSLVTEAEREYGGGTGALKLSAVLTELYPKLPALIKMLVSEEHLTDWIEEALAAAKSKWETNMALATYIEGNQTTEQAKNE